VEATLKQGKRHIYAKRVFFLDEDSWTALASDQYDATGKLYRSSFAFQSQSYDVQAPFGDTFAIYDFNTGAYNITGLFGPHQGLRYMTELPKESAWSPDALAGSGLR
jgi:ABC-type transporter lipoprotein component MlaA